MEVLGRRRDRLTFLSCAVANDVPDPATGHSPSAVQAEEVVALIDTGATVTLIDADVASRLTLPTDGSVPLVFPNSAEAEHRTAYRGSLLLARDPTVPARVPWPALVRLANFEAGLRPFRMVLGMDVLSRGDLTLERGGAVRFAFDPF